MLTYAECESLWALQRGPRSGIVRLDNNTVLYKKPDDSFAVRLHNTEVVTIYPDGSYRLDSGGYRTVTTKDRINRYGPVRVYAERGVWYFGRGVLFRDDVIVTAADQARSPDCDGEKDN